MEKNFKIKGEEKKKKPKAVVNSIVFRVQQMLINFAYITQMANKDATIFSYLFENTGNM